MACFSNKIFNMRFCDAAKCHICKRIFCCAKCRQKHQFESHAIAVRRPTNMEGEREEEAENGIRNVENETGNRTIYVFCPICELKPLALQAEMYAELLAHIESVHLPLRCRKCLRHYTKIEDLQEFSRCVNLGQNCSSASSGQSQNQSCDTDASKVTVKKTVIGAQSSTGIANDLNNTHQLHQQEQTQDQFQQHLNLTPISLFNLRWKAKCRLTQEEFISDSVSSIRNLSSDSVNISVQQRRSIGQITGGQTLDASGTGKVKGKLIRSTSTPLQVCSMFAKPKETLTFNASAGGSGHMSSIYHSGYVLEEHNTPAGATAPAPDNSNVLVPQRAWKMQGRGKMSAVTPLRQVMSKSIQKAFVEHGVGMLAHQGEQRRLRLDLSENNTTDGGAALDLRLSPAMRRTHSENSIKGTTTNNVQQPYQIMLSAQKLTTESIIITRSSNGGSLPVSNASTTSTVYNSCESVEIIRASSSTSELSVLPAAAAMPPITPRIPGAIINKKLIKFETPPKKNQPKHQADESTQEDKDIFYTPNSPATHEQNHPSAEQRHRQQIVPRQLSGQFSPEHKMRPVMMPRPQGPRARPPLRTFSCVQDIESDDEVFLPSSASTHNDKKCSGAAVYQSEQPGRLWSLMSSVMRLPATLRSDRLADKKNASSGASAGSGSTSGSLIRRCASIAGSLVRSVHVHDDPELQTMKRKRTQTLDNNQYSSQISPSSSSSKRLRIQPRKPIERMRNK